MKVFITLILLFIQTTPPKFIFIDGHCFLVIGYYQEYMHSANCNECKRLKELKDKAAKDPKLKKPVDKAPAKPKKIT